VHEGVHVALLGPVTATGPAATVMLGGPKERGVLAVLALHAGETVSDSRLIESVWGEEAPRSAAKLVQNQVLRLRKALAAAGAGDAIETRGGGYVLARGATVDVAEVERLAVDAQRASRSGNAAKAAALLRDALAGWRGQPLAGLAELPFAQLEVVRLAELRWSLLEQCIDAELELGRHAELVPELEGAIAEEPLRERLRIQHLLALYRSGRQVDALRAYQAYRTTLADETGLSPSAEMVELDRAIASQSPQLDLTAHSLPSGDVTFVFTDIEGSTRLFHRLGEAFEALIDQHDQLLRAAVEQHGGTVVKSAGDGILAAFSAATDAADAAAAIQVAVTGASWPGDAAPRVRIGIQSGHAAPVGGDYVALAVHHAARICDAAQGGQIFLGALSTSQLGSLRGGFSVRDLGPHRLRDFPRAEHIFQLEGPGLPRVEGALRTLANLAPDVPVFRTRFVGRAEELTELEAMLRSTGLVTVTGPGGVGKTRLAAEVCFRVLDHYADGARFVDLAPLADPSLVGPAVARAAGVREEPGRPLLETLVAALRTSRLLLIVDNCEHLIDAVASLLEPLAQRCPSLGLLVTSRESLRIEGEVIWRLAPLPAPPLTDLSDQSDPAEMAVYDAVALLVALTRQGDAGFALTAANAGTVASIAARLDGMPLALELAAARVGDLGVDAVAQALDDRFEILTQGRRTALPRQQTLEAAIAWSFDLLDAEDQELFSRLSPFAGGFSAEAAHQVVGGTPAHIAEALARLASASLLVLREHDDSLRFVMLESVRAFALDRLERAGDALEFRDRHLAWAVATAERASACVYTSEEFDAFAQLDLDFDSCREALRWAPSGRTPHEGLRLGAALGEYWFVRGLTREGAIALDTALAQVDATPEVRAAALLAAGLVFSTDIQRATRLRTEAVELFRRLGDHRGITHALCDLAHSAYRVGDLERAQQLVDEAMHHARELGEPRWLALAYDRQANILEAEGRYAEERDVLVTALELYSEAGDLRAVTWMEGCIGMADVRLGDPGAGRTRYHEMLTLAGRLGDAAAWAWANCAVGELALDEGDLVSAREHLTTGRRGYERFGAPLELAWPLRRLARLALYDGDTDEARQFVAEALDIALRESQHAHGELLILLLVEAAEGRHDQVARLVGALRATEAAHDGIRMLPSEVAEVAAAAEASRAALGERAFEAARLEGASGLRPGKVRARSATGEGL
jgi:predicted ATPase/class 3 adenylate cyclase/DNA-binding winged helix-turn-helix (wHTH) protein